MWQGNGSVGAAYLDSDLSGQSAHAGSTSRLGPLGRQLGPCPLAPGRVGATAGCAPFGDLEDVPPGCARHRLGQLARPQPEDRRLELGWQLAAAHPAQLPTLGRIGGSRHLAGDLGEILALAEALSGRAGGRLVGQDELPEADPEAVRRGAGVPAEERVHLGIAGKGRGWAEAKSCLAHLAASDRRRQGLSGCDPGRGEEHLLLEETLEEGGDQLG